MHLHILGLSGTFMSALAYLAKTAGHRVTGSDLNIYPPVSDFLDAQGIVCCEGYDDADLALKADIVVMGNVMKRGMPVVEAVLNARKSYVSGPEWLATHILQRYQVMAVAGTHGKTTTSSILAYILDHAGLNPGFLIGGIARNFDSSACLGKGKFFVIEADEYDSAFFDKRPKFMHYRPQLAILTNLEFDHVDIYPNLAAIEQQFQYFLRTIPSEGRVISLANDPALQRLAPQRYAQTETIGLLETADWQAKLHDETGQAFSVCHRGVSVAEVEWSLLGRFNVENALAALAASFHAGVDPSIAAQALAQYLPVKRRLELRSNRHGIAVYDDFAHHPTAIAKTIDALLKSSRHQRIMVVLEFASHTMRSGVHHEVLESALSKADGVFLLAPSSFDMVAVCRSWIRQPQIKISTQEIIVALLEQLVPGDAVLVMSNRSFDGIHQELIGKIDEVYHEELRI